MSIRVQCIAVDARDPRTLGHWWGAALGWHVWDEGDDVALEPPKGSGQIEIVFLRVPEAKTVKNRLHLDLRPEDQAAEVARFEALGATRVDIGQGDQSWVVMADPKGNEFCILRAHEPDESS